MLFSSQNLSDPGQRLLPQGRGGLALVFWTSQEHRGLQSADLLARTQCVRKSLALYASGCHAQSLLRDSRRTMFMLNFNFPEYPENSVSGPRSLTSLSVALCRLIYAMLYSSFDLALLYETIYYLKDPEKCISEALRVLREGSIFVVCTVNKDWEDFHPSAYTYKYFSATDLYDLMSKSFRVVKIYGGFPVNSKGTKSGIISLMKRSAVKLHLIPGSLKARAYLKRIFMGKLVPLPHEVTEGMCKRGTGYFLAHVLSTS